MYAWGAPEEGGPYICGPYEPPTPPHQRGFYNNPLKGRVVFAFARHSGECRNDGMVSESDRLGITHLCYPPSNFLLLKMNTERTGRDLSLRSELALKRECSSRTRPGVYHSNPGFGEIPDVARRHGHPARQRDRRALAIRLRHRTPGGATGGCYVRIGARRIAVER